MSAGAHGSQKRASDPLELELQEVLSHQEWVLGTKNWCSEKAARLLIIEPPPWPPDISINSCLFMSHIRSNI